MARRSRAKNRSDKIREKLLPESAGIGVVGEEQPFANGDNIVNDRRIKDCASARELYDRLWQEAQIRLGAFAQIRNQIEGGRPFDPGAIIRNGEAWRTNVNFNDARAAFRRAALPYWKMVNEVPRRISVTFHSTAPQADQWAIAMAEVFDMFLDDWGPDYFMQFSGFCDDFVMYGPGYVMWPDGSTPRFKWAQTVQMFFPKRTRSNVDDWELVALKREITCTELIGHVQNGRSSAAAKTAGWNTDAVMQAVKLAAPGPQYIRFFDPNFYQDMIVANDLVIGGVWPPVSVIDVWARSRDGKKIRHYIFTEKADVQDYLYEADEEAESFRQLFGAVFYSVGSNGLLHSVKGFGVMNYYYATAINRTKCRMLDSATFAMGMNFRKTDNTPDGAPPVENVSMLNVFPEGLEQLQWYPNLSVGIELIQQLKQSADENNFAYNEIKDTIAETDTATQAKLVAGIGAEMGTATSAIFLSQVGHNIFTEQMNRLCKKGSTDPDAKKFRERCKRLGVPDKAFDLERFVKTGANPMLADPAQRSQIIMAGRQAMYNLPGSNKKWWDEMTVADLFGAEAVKKAFLPDGTGSQPGARRQAIMENVDMGQGVELPVAPEDAHTEHIEEHLKPMVATIQAMRQQKVPPTPDHMIMFQVGLPHIQQHLQYLQQDETKKQDFMNLNAAFNEVASVYKGLATRLAKAHQQSMGDAGAASSALVAQQ